MADEMFNEAVKAAKAGQRRRARDLLTRLIKADQNNVDYWLWMSAVVDTEKEQIFCLQKALKVDPNSVAARRGLVVLGAMRPEDAALPPPQVLEAIPVEIPELQKGGGFAGFLSRRRNQEVLLVSGIGVVALVMVALVVMTLTGAFRPRRQVAVVASSPTASRTPAATATATPTNTPKPCTLPASPNPATPLAVYLCLTQTPTAVAVATERALSEDYRTVIRAYNAGEWQKIVDRAAVITRDPTLTDNARVYFYIAEAHRHLAGDKASDPNLREALSNYRTAISKDGGFAPAYWGKALTELVRNNPNEALNDFNNAIVADPNFAPAYLDRGIFYALNGNFTRALEDLEQARLVAPENALVLANLSLAYADTRQPQPALEAAQQALDLDPGMALAYFARGRAEYALGNFAEADKDLSLSYLYVKNAPPLYPTLWQARILYDYGLGKFGVQDDAAALAAFDDAIKLRTSFPPAYLARGQVRLRAQNYKDANADFNTAISQFKASDANNPALNDAYLGNGQALLGLNRPDSALTNFQIVVRSDPQNFEGQIGLGQSLLLTKKAEDSLAAFQAALDAAQTGAQRARVYYWRAQAFEALGRKAEQIADLAALAEIADAPGGLAPTAIARLTEIGPLPTDTPTPTETATPAPTSAASATPTPGKITATATTRQATPTLTPGAISATPTRTPTPTGTRTPTRTP
jgi:tetratricopeptide (TPR) repeat protein